MKKVINLLVLLLLISCSTKDKNNNTPELTTDNFDFNGPLGSEGAQIEKLDKNHFKIMLNHAPGHENWANNTQFMITGNARGNNLILDVIFNHDNPKHLFNNNFCSWSYDMENWHPVKWKYAPKKSLNKDHLMFPLFNKDTVYVGYQVPLSHEKLEEYIDQWKKSPYVSVYTIGKSTGGKNIYRITLSNIKDPSADPWVHYFANQHAGEHNSQWRMIGMINYLLNEGQEYLNKSVNHFVILSSPDAPQNGWFRVNREGKDLNREYLESGSDSSVQSKEGYLLQRDFEDLMNSSSAPHTTWAMHTWVGPVEIWMNPGPEIGKLIPEWDVLKEILQRNDPDGLLEPLQKRPSKTTGSWAKGPNAQFGITNFLCEGGRDFYTREKNERSGKVIMKSIVDYYQ